MRSKHHAFGPLFVLVPGAELVRDRLDGGEPARRVRGFSDPARELADKGEVAVSVSSQEVLLVPDRARENATRSPQGDGDSPMPVHLFTLPPVSPPSQFPTFHLDTPFDDAVLREPPEVLHLEDDRFPDLAAVRDPLPDAMFRPEAARRVRREFLVFLR